MKHFRTIARLVQVVAIGLMTAGFSSSDPECAGWRVRSEIEVMKSFDCTSLIRPVSNADKKGDREAIVPPVVSVRTRPNHVPIYSSADGNRISMDVEFGGQTLRMVLDTGAVKCMIPENIAAAIISSGQGTWLEPRRFTMADGTIRALPVLRVHEVRINQHIIRDVPAAVSSNGTALLAFPVVNGIAPFTIDTRAGKLIFQPDS